MQSRFFCRFYHAEWRAQPCARWHAVTRTQFAFHRKTYWIGRNMPALLSLGGGGGRVERGPDELINSNGPSPWLTLPAPVPRLCAQCGAAEGGVALSFVNARLRPSADARGIVSFGWPVICMLRALNRSCRKLLT